MQFNVPAAWSAPLLLHGSYPIPSPSHAYAQGFSVQARWASGDRLPKGEKDYFICAKFFSIASPLSWDFSGWNWAATTLSRQMAAQKSMP
jgi:hypothetical protein